MRYEEVTPHLNKISTLYLRNNKRKTGWLFADAQNHIIGNEKILFVNVRKGRKMKQAHQPIEKINTELEPEQILVDDLVRIRSSR
jgi:iron-sulfur cluster repair protein YtfE (RIC family)